jgi:hypothetical protein
VWAASFAFRLEADSRWFVTGTPFDGNNCRDIESLRNYAKFLKVEVKFQTIEKPGSAAVIEEFLRRWVAYRARPRIACCLVPELFPLLLPTVSSSVGKRSFSRSRFPLTWTR